jgi:type IV pilus modification protein PilV
LKEGRMLTVRATARGFSLVEALIAATILGVGLIGLAKLQTLVMGSSSVSQQRNEATQIAQDKIEYFRAFSTLPSANGQRAYTDIASSTSAETVTGVSASYERRWAAVDCCFDGSSAPVCPAASCVSSMRFKQLEVTVSWTDKANKDRSVVLRTIIAGLDPELDAALMNGASTGGS